MIREYIISGLLIVLITGSLFLGILILTDGVDGYMFKGKLSRNYKNGAIAVIKITGIIQSGPEQSALGFKSRDLDNLIKQLYYIKDNKSIKGIILRINSPGGTIGAVQEIYNALLELKKSGKKIVVSMADVAASGGYYVSMPADCIMANPGTLTGSIGVIFSTINLKGLFERYGIKYNVVKSGEHKDIMAMYRDMTNEEKKLMQNLIDDAFNQFYNVVLKNRKIKSSLLKKYADGRLFTGRQAYRLKLIDEMGTFKDAIKKAGELTGLGENPPIITEGTHPFSLLFGNMSARLSVNIPFLQQNNYSPVLYLYKP